MASHIKFITLEQQKNKKIFLIISGLFIGVLVYFITDIMLKTVPPWKRKKQLAELAAQDSAKNTGLDSVYLVDFQDTLTYTYRVGKNEVLGKIAEKFNLSIDTLKTMNGLNDDKIAENQRLKVRIRALHRVQKGEMVSNIAKKYGVEASEILQVNKIKNAKQVWADQVLAIPIPSKH